MSHFEGPVVDAFYEIALHSWYNRLSPPLPCMTTPYHPPRDHSGRIHYLFQDHNPYFDDIEIMKAARAARILLRRQTKEMGSTEPLGRERFRDTVRKVVDQRRHNLADWIPGEELEARRQLAVDQLRDFRDRWVMSSRTSSRAPSRAPSRSPSQRSSAVIIPSVTDGELVHSTLVVYFDGARHNRRTDSCDHRPERGAE